MASSQFVFLAEYYNWSRKKEDKTGGKFNFLGTIKDGTAERKETARYVQVRVEQRNSDMSAGLTRLALSLCYCP